MNMTRVVLHVGLHKTGTTFLQQNVFPLIDPLAVAFNPTGITEAIRSVYRSNYRSDVVEKESRTIGKIVQESNRPVLVSYEVMSGSPWVNYADLDKMVDVLQKSFGSATIVVLLRNQIDWLISLYREGLKDGVSASPAKFFDPGKCSSKSHWHEGVESCEFDFAKIVDTYESRFGPEHTKVLFYETLHSDPHRFLDRFESASGIAMPHHFKDTRVNPSLGTSGVLCLARLRQLPFQSPFPRHRWARPTVLLESILRKNPSCLSNKVLNGLSECGLTDKLIGRRKMRRQLRLARWISSISTSTHSIIPDYWVDTLRTNYAIKNRKLEKYFGHDAVREQYYLGR
jgi:hypothetical protein